MSNFATLADVEKVLIRPIVDAAEIEAVEFALTVVSAAIRNYTNQFIELVTYDTVTLYAGRGPLLFLPELPVVSVSEVRVEGTGLVVTDDYRLARDGVLVRQGARSWALVGTVPTVVEVDYSHGYEVIPDDIMGVCARAASRLFQAGLRAQATGGVLGVASKALGDFSVSYTAEGAAEGSMGASGARVLVLSEKDLLNKYKL